MWTLEKRLVLKGLLDSGKKKTKIAEEMEITSDLLYDELRRGKLNGSYCPYHANNNYKFYLPRVFSEKEKAFIKESLSKGIGYTRITRELKCGSQALRKYLTEADLDSKNFSLRVLSKKVKVLENHINLLYSLLEDIKK
jgi:transposase-like protein